VIWMNLAVIIPRLHHRQ